MTMASNHTWDTLTAPGSGSKYLKLIAKTIGIDPFRRCQCGWGDDCIRFRILFCQAKDEHYSFDPKSQTKDDLIRLTITNTQYKEAVLSNLMTTATEKAIFLRLAPFHFSRHQIELKRSRGASALSIPLPFSELNVYTEIIDKNFEVETTNKKGDKVLKYYNLPNIPKSTVEIDAKAAGTVSDGQKNSSEYAKKRKCETLTIQQYCAKEEEIFNLRRQLEEKDSKIEEKDSKIKELKSEIRQLKSKIRSRKRYIKRCQHE